MSSLPLPRTSRFRFGRWCPLRNKASPKSDIRLQRRFIRQHRLGLLPRSEQGPCHLYERKDAPATASLGVRTTNKQSFKRAASLQFHRWAVPAHEVATLGCSSSHAFSLICVHVNTTSTTRFGCCGVRRAAAKKRSCLAPQAQGGRWWTDPHRQWYISMSLQSHQIIVAAVEIDFKQRQHQHVSRRGTSGRDCVSSDVNSGLSEIREPLRKAYTITAKELDVFCQIRFLQLGGEERAW